MTRRHLLWGLAAVAAYVAAGTLTAGLALLPVRPLYDGVAPPQPYRYVDPPPDQAGQNVRPEPHVSTVEFTPEGSVARSVATPEGQAIVVFRLGGVVRAEGAEAAEITLTPLAPSELPEVEGELQAVGNAYRVAGRYVPSGDPVELTQPISVVLRYPVHGTHLLRLEDGTWEPLDTDVSESSLQLFAESEELGTFVAAGIPEGGGFPLRSAALGVAAVAAASGGFLVGRIRGRKKEEKRRAELRRQQEKQKGKGRKRKRRGPAGE